MLSRSASVRNLSRVFSTCDGVRWTRVSTKKIDVILVKDFANLGFRGDQVAVKPGYIRNYLHPQKIAVYATDENKAKFLREKDAAELARIQEELKQKAVQKKLSKVEIAFKRHCTEVGPLLCGEKLYGSVTSANILTSLRK